MKRSSLDILEGKMREAISEGLVVKYQASDEDLPSIFWPDIEEKFWSELERILDAKV
jgi:hypothetical protein